MAQREPVGHAQGGGGKFQVFDRREEGGGGDGPGWLPFEVHPCLLKHGVRLDYSIREITFFQGVFDGRRKASGNEVGGGGVLICCLF